MLHCWQPWWGPEHFYLPEKNDHAPPCNSSFPLFLTEPHCRLLLSDSIVPLLSYYLALDPLGLPCTGGRTIFPSSSDFLLEGGIENYDLWIWSFNVMSLHVDLFMLNLEICVCLPLMRYMCTHMYRHCMVSVQDTGTSTHLSIKMWGCLSQLCKMVQCLQMICLHPPISC